MAVEVDAAGVAYVVLFVQRVQRSLFLLSISVYFRSAAVRRGGSSLILSDAHSLFLELEQQQLFSHHGGSSLI